MRTYKSALDAKLDEEYKFDQKYPNGCTYQQLADYKWPVRKEWGNWSLVDFAQNLVDGDLPEVVKFMCGIK